MKTKLLLGLSLLMCASALAQPGWNWPEDKAKAEEKNVLYTDNMNAGNFQVAATHLSWLLTNAPDLNKSIYINGAKIYEGLADAEKEAGAKYVFVDSAMLMYDLRVQYFGEEANVLNRKAYKAYKYQKDRKDKYGELFDLFKKTFELNGKKIYDNNLVAYMDVVRRHKLTGGSVTDEEVIDIYSIVNDQIDYKISLGKNVDRLERYRENVDKLLTATVTVDCAFVEKNLVPKMQANPADLKMAKKVFQLLLTGKCSDNPAFVESAKLVHEAEPAYGLAIVIAKKCSGEKDYECAEQYFSEALELTDDNTKKAGIYFDQAKMSAARGLKSKARSLALQAVQTDPTKTGVYSFIGSLYMTSYDDCKKGKSRLEDRAVFIAAYEMFRRGGDSRGMASAKQQIPSIEDIFEQNKKEGESFTISCWFTETVTIQRRP